VRGSDWRYLFICCLLVCMEGAAARVARQAGTRVRKQALELSEAAAARIRELLEKRHKEFLKLSVKSRGCSGLSYTMSYAGTSPVCVRAVEWRLHSADTPGKFDELVEGPLGVKVLVDNKALMHVVGTRMDFVSNRLRCVQTVALTAPAAPHAPHASPGLSLCSRTPTRVESAAAESLSPPERRIVEAGQTCLHATRSRALSGCGCGSRTCARAQAGGFRRAILCRQTYVATSLESSAVSGRGCTRRLCYACLFSAADADLARRDETLKDEELFGI
jgi:iron-sulfur cluster assembly protein